MKAPFEEKPGTRELKARARPVGGKALARLELFLSARGLDGEIAEVTGRPLRGRKRARQRRIAGRNVGALYAAAARALHVEEESAPPETTLAAAPAEAAPPPAPFDPALGPGWRPLGPTYMPNGQTYGASRVDVSGRIAALALDPGNVNHILVGSAAGGIWESRDRGATWAPRTDFAPTLTTGAIVFDPTAPATVYCGTGEGNWWARLGAGVLRSTDVDDDRHGAFRGDGFLRPHHRPGESQPSTGRDDEWSVRVRQRGSDLDRTAKPAHLGSLHDARRGSFRGGPRCVRRWSLPIDQRRHDVGCGGTARGASGVRKARGGSCALQSGHRIRLRRERVDGAPLGARGRLPRSTAHPRRVP